MSVTTKSVAIDQLPAIDKALDTLLSAIIAHDAKRDAQPSETPLRANFVSFDDLASFPPRQADLGEMLADPIRYGLRETVIHLGRQIFRLSGSTDAMRDALERVAEMDPRHYGYRATIMDKAWDGIGDDKDRWWS
ncbi:MULTISPECIES: hypothetical protein [Methylobacterium]|jgi:hypothetical protein|uniref:hypothetical protein n=1 Tax=Methylobacterium TaxID=407 RepID=UPI0008E7D2CE|nr:MULTISPECIES: hypothetical protein [Methylobacterium]MBZ6415366.1 hypothetical protein [Methylobacterium sp.]MBK3397643.1 hypothetical protein [Methylobacterium ajmalii]MBK3412502.1 hypothetical protein [Methylobacterium ajmalii]MBK3426763.1 hypothetical protein [Methylobacterium ajmalii]SFF67877.1 hypothetical protein SAMN04487844_13725 [Methylobacterium sp. yr596]